MIRLAKAAGAWVFYHISRAVLTKLARAIFVMLDAADIAYWADFGTLLGLVRDEGIIYKDTDVDVCVIENAQTLARLDACTHRHHTWFVLKKDLHRRSYCAYMRLLPARCDIYVYRPDGALLRGCEGPHSDVPRALVQERMRWSWRGIDVMVPKAHRELLVWRYGDDWETKREQYLGRLHSTYYPRSDDEARLRRTNIAW